MKYDITTKRLLEIGKSSILKHFLSLDIESAEILEELPQETVSIRSTDFPIKIKDIKGQEFILLLEIQTEWKEDKLFDFIGYWARFKKKYKIEVESVMFLFQKNEKAVSYYKDKNVHFNFTLIKFWELEPKDYINSNEFELFPFIPLMNDGVKFVDDAEKKIYSGNIDRDKKADLLTALSIFTGMKDANLAQTLWKRRRDIMIESPVYDMILKEGKLEDKNEIAKTMLRKGYDFQEISEITGLSIEKIKQLKENKD